MMHPKNNRKHPGLARLLILLAALAFFSMACNLLNLALGEGPAPTPSPALPEAPLPTAIQTAAFGVPTEGLITPLPLLTETSAAPPTAEATPGQPSGKIVYTCQLFRHQLRNQICMMNADGSNPVRMTTDDEVNHLFPALAPDGQSVVFSANNDVNYEIYELTLVGDLRKVTNLPGDANAPSISPDGSKILFSYTIDAQQSLWIVNRDGSDPHAVESEFQGTSWDPVWSPDGSQILFASDREGLPQLFLVNADGSGARRLTDLSGVRGRSDWSPDGSLITTYVGDPWKREIYIMHADGSDPNRITDGGNNLAPSFSPDGQWMVFTSYRDLYLDNNGCEIYTMRADGTDVRRLTDNNYCDWQPRWGK